MVIIAEHTAFADTAVVCARRLHILAFVAVCVLFEMTRRFDATPDATRPCFAGPFANAVWAVVGGCEWSISTACMVLGVNVMRSPL